MPKSLNIVVLYNCDFETCDPAAADLTSRADVLQAARGIAKALATRGHQTALRGINNFASCAALAELKHGPAPDLVFNLCESLAGDARHEIVVPALLELLDIPYTGSGPFALSLALRKNRTKEILRARGIPTPESVLLTHADLDALPLPGPLIVKPAHEDASVGIHSTSVVHDLPALKQAISYVLNELHQPALVEQFIAGRELYVSLLGNHPPEALPFHEIDFSTLPPHLPRIVSYAGKWDTSSVEFIGTKPIRCLLPEATRQRIENIARATFAALELRDYGRVDFRLADDGTPYVIDVNPNCDLSDGAGFSRAAGFAGLDYPTLIERVCYAALERAQGSQTFKT